jgi:hypothetical protein
MKQRTGVAAIALGVAVSVAGLASFTTTRMLRDTEDAAIAGSDSAVEQVTPAPNSTPTPQGRPDTSRPSWARVFLDQESSKQRYEQTIGPIRLIPGGKPASGPADCAAGAEWATTSEADASSLAIRPAFLPPGATVDPSMNGATRCGSRVVNVERTYVVPAEANAESRVRSGAANWFDIEHGGYVWVWRTLIPGPNYFGSEVPSGQWAEATIAGLPAAVGKPTLDGLGHATVVVWDPQSGILTVVRGLDRTADEVVHVAEGVVR